MDPTKAVLFYLLALALAVAVALTPGATSFVYMFTPLVAALLMLFVVTRDGYSRTGLKVLGFHRLGLRGWPFALLVPFVVISSAYALVWGTHVADFVVPKSLAGHPIAGLQWLLFPPILLLSIVFATLTNSLGEEIGWRGYLLPRLESLGRVKAILLTGLMHAFWHFPFILMTTQYHADGNRLIVLTLFVLSVTAAGFSFGYVRLTTQSVWPAALLHSAHNVLWGFAPFFTATSTPLVNEYLVGDSGALITLGYTLVALWVVYRLGASRGARLPREGARVGALK